MKLERRLTEHLLHQLGDPPIALHLWDGTLVCTSDSAPLARGRFLDRATFWRVVRDPTFQLGEAYSQGTFVIDGDFPTFIRTVLTAMPRQTPGAYRRGGLRDRWNRRHSNSLAAARENIHHHYDLGNDFYRLWLDERMLYTCAYFPEPGMTLEQAQLAKLDHVCRKLRLRPGETVIEAGCGWGGLALHMAARYGVTVRAFNISHEQIVYSRARARAENLDGRVEFIEDDWRNITGRCDAFVSVGMLEHVGIDNYAALGRIIATALHPEGRGLIHSIGRNYPLPVNPWIERRIFPGGEPPSIAEMMGVFESQDFSVLDVENLRPHYAWTLAHWLERFEEHAEEIAARQDEAFVRAWRLYLTMSQVAFEIGTLQLFQVVFVPGRCTQVPRSRAALYAADAGLSEAVPPAESTEPAAAS